MRDHTDVGFKLCASCRGWFMFDSGELCDVCRKFRSCGDSVGLVWRRSQLFQVHSWAWFHLHREDSPVPADTQPDSNRRVGEIDQRINQATPAGQGELFHG